jgi:hypothetical protein
LNYKFVEIKEKKNSVTCYCAFVCLQSPLKKCSDTEIKSYSIGQIFLIPAKFSLYLSIM